MKTSYTLRVVTTAIMLLLPVDEVSAMDPGPTANVIRLQIFRADVQDHRDDTWGWTAYSRPRLQVGYFSLDPVGKLTDQLRSHDERGEVREGHDKLAGS
jgi:hypothetical protein